MKTYEAIMASVWTGKLTQGTRCEVARCGSPELARELAETLNSGEADKARLGAMEAAMQNFLDVFETDIGSLDCTRSIAEATEQARAALTLSRQ